MTAVDVVPADDRGFTLGDGLFETLLWQDGGFEDWDAHMDRLTRGCTTLGLPAPDRAVLLKAATAGVGELERAAVRLTWTAGSGGRGLNRPQFTEPRLTVVAARALESAEPLRAAIVSVRRNEGSPASRLKTASYIDSVCARREAQAAQADEAIQLNNRGELACGAAANLFWLRGSALYTPALDCGVLDGIMRGRIIAAVAGFVSVHEVKAGADALKGADALYLSSSLIGLKAVSHLNGLEISQQPAFQVQVGQSMAADRRGRR